MICFVSVTAGRDTVRFASETRILTVIVLVDLMACRSDVFMENGGLLDVERVKQVSLQLILAQPV